MAYDKIIAVRTRLDHCIGYVLNREKTDLAAVRDYIGNAEKTTLTEEQTMLETGLNCTLETACADMTATKRRWAKPGGVLGYHLIHSFAPGEVTPRQAHEIGVEFAAHLLGDRYEAVVSTHLDRDHLHCHILFNSVSFLDGRKYHNTFQDYFRDIRGISNEVSRAHGLSVIEPSGKGVHYAEWDAERQGKTTIRSLIRQDIDAAVSDAFTYQSLFTVLEKRGYTVKRGPQIQHTAVRPPGGVRFIRLDSLGADYTEEAIKRRLSAVRSGKTIPKQAPPPTVPMEHHRYKVCSGSVHQPRRKLRGFRLLYVRYLYLLGVRRPAAERQIIPFTVRQEVTRLHRYQRQFRFLLEYRIDTAPQLSMLGDALQAELDALTSRRKDLYRLKRCGGEVTAELTSINQTMRRCRRKLHICEEITADIPRIQAQEQLCRETRQEEQKAAQKEEKSKKRRFDRWM
ncbi:relaxase/mobilization nuclease domain-containing protein [Dysosmobacter sp.]|jgi:hypothetical protein|uniref:relaxase/mobilization nuclease domain-containing protein n=1 Tax=Dysosmobacter sp. TaxID=2591382 RepID=UPI003D906C6C